MFGVWILAVWLLNRVAPVWTMAVTLYGADGTPYILSAAPQPLQQSAPAYVEPTLYMSQPQVASSVSYQPSFVYQQQPTYQQPVTFAYQQPQTFQQSPSFGYQQQQPVGYGNQQQQQQPIGYGNQQQPQQPIGYGNQQQQTYGGNQQQQSYGGSQQQQSYGGSQQQQSYGNQPKRRQPKGYSSNSRHDDGGEGGGYKKKKKVEKIYVPVRVKRKKKKMKIIQVQPGFYIQGGSQLLGKYKSLKACQKACAATPYCFAGDYNPWLKKCYLHSNTTACDLLHAHKKLIHFKKVPCFIPEAPEGLITLGAQLFRGIEQKGIKSLSDCIKKCATAGLGIPESVVDIDDQLCFGIDYDFGTHKCYFHVDNTDNRICPDDGSTPNTPRDQVANAAVVSILLCPGP